MLVRKVNYQQAGYLQTPNCVGEDLCRQGQICLFEIVSFKQSLSIYLYQHYLLRKEFLYLDGDITMQFPGEPRRSAGVLRQARLSVTMSLGVVVLTFSIVHQHYVID